MENVVTRFAPSPTGYLHIGGARTALFNYLWARHNQGKFLLRIEDTDASRHNDDASAAILRALNWMGLDWDDEAVHQSTRVKRHREVVDELLSSGAAYRDYATEEEVSALKRRWEIEGHKGPFRYNSVWRDHPHAEDRPFAVRMRINRGGETTIDDHVQGRVVVQNQQIEDFVLLRSDRTAPFLLAGAVDDHDMGVNWVIRGDDHLNNAFKQKLIYDAMGWEMPDYAHVPLIHNAAGKKYSKRDGAASVEEFAEDFRPDAFLNYLMRLGWGHGNDEVISRDQAIEWFDIKKVGRNPARFDEKKLTSLNSHYVRSLPVDEFARLVGIAPELEWLVPEVKRRITKITEALPYLRFLKERPPPVYEQHSLALLPYLEGTEWTPDALKAATDTMCAESEVTLREVAEDVRWSLTGLSQSLSVFDIMAALGRDETVRRLLGNRFPGAENNEKQDELEATLSVDD